MSEETTTSMHTTESDSLVSRDGLQEELQAALAEIEKLSGPTAADATTPEEHSEETAGELDEHSSSAVTPSAEKSAGAVRELDADVDADASAPASEHTPPALSVADDNPPATAETAKPSYESILLAGEELAAELTKIGQMSEEEAAAVPSLSDSQDEKESPPARDELRAAKPDSAQTAADKSPGEATVQPAQKKPRFRIGKKAEEEGVAEYQPPEQRGDAALVTHPAASLGKRIYRTVDRGLDAINRPFDRTGGRGRMLVGYLAATTLIVSILAMILMPLVMPHRDAIVFLQEKRAALDIPPVTQDAGEQDAATPEPE